MQILSELSIRNSVSTFYPLPMLSSKVTKGTVCTTFDLYRTLYNGYNMGIDITKLSDLYSSRFDDPPNEHIADIWGEEMGYLYNFSQKNTTTRAITIRHFFTHEPIQWLVDNHTTLYWHLVRMPAPIPSVDIVIDGYAHPFGDKIALAQALCGLKPQPIDWRGILDLTFRMAINGARVKILEGPFFKRASKYINSHSYIVRINRNEFMVSRPKKQFRFFYFRFSNRNSYPWFGCHIYGNDFSRYSKKIQR